MATVSTTVHLEAVIQDQEEAYSPHTRDTLTPEFHDEREAIHTSPFSITNVLKKERVNSPENVFSTEKLLENTPNFDNHSESTSPRLNSNDINVDDHDNDNSCCSDDTVLSVGNEAPPSESKGHETNLTSFKHIQTHLNAISHLSQNLNMPQPLLLRPSPINPNPLLFLNQPLIFQNPILNQEMKCVPRMVGNLPSPQFNLNFGHRKSQTQELRNARTDENRRLNYLSPKSPDHESDFINHNCLKFSIDNILKADFGRRITDPLKRKKVKNYEAKSPVKEPQPEGEARVPDVKAGEKGGAIDLSKGDDSSSNPGSAPGSTSGDGPMVWPAWVYCTRYSDRPSSGRSKYGNADNKQPRPRTRRPKKPPGETTNDEKRPRTAFSGPQLARLKHEFAENRYLTERRRQALAAELGLAEAQIKIWFQNKRAKIKKASGQRNPLALQLMAQGLYNHSTVPLTKEEEELEMKARERDQQNRR